MGKEVSATDAGLEDEKIRGWDVEQETFQPLQQHFPLEMPSFDCSNQLPMSGVSRGIATHIVKSATAMTMQQVPFHTIYSAQSSPSEQMQVQMPHAMFSFSTAPLSTSDGNETYDRESEVSTPTVPDEGLANTAICTRVLPRAVAIRHHFSFRRTPAESLRGLGTPAGHSVLD